MLPKPGKIRGFTLIELLVVLSIVAILTAVGVVQVGNRSGSAVRQVLDDLEGTLSAAQKTAVATGQDILLVTQGDWAGGNPLILAYGTANQTTATILNNGRTVPESFRLAVRANGAIQREHMHAGVVTAATQDWWGTVTGGGTADVSTVAPFKDVTTGFQAMLAEPNLFRGGTDIGTIRISGADKRFTASFWIEVVGLQSGAPIPGGPLGLLVVPANGASIYKFYNPGARSGGQWRRM